MKRNVTYLKLFILINISNLYSFKLNKTTTKIFFNDILNFCKKNKKLTCSLSIPIVLSIGYLIYKKSEFDELNKSRLIYKKSEFDELNKIENHELFKIFKEKLYESKDKNINKQEQAKDKEKINIIENNTQSQEKEKIKEIYKKNIIEFVKILNNYKEKGSQDINSSNLTNNVTNALNNNLQEAKDKSQVNNIENFVEDFEKANHKFRNKIISRINKMFSLDKNKESIFSFSSIISFFKRNFKRNKGDNNDKINDQSKGDNNDKINDQGKGYNISDIIRSNSLGDLNN